MQKVTRFVVGIDGKDGVNGKDGIDGVNGSNGIDGANGVDGKDGLDGKDGKDGVDGHSPIVAIAKDVDEMYYWTVDGLWILDAEGNKIRAVGIDGKDGVNGKDGANGLDGKDGRDGKDGLDGINGIDGHSPILAVAKDEDDVFYWTLEGEWLLDGDNNKLRVTGQDGKEGANGLDGKDGKDGIDGITPLLKIEDDYWWLSYDNAETWTKLDKAKGEKGDKGDKGDSMFESVTQDADSAYFVLADGSALNLPKHTKGMLSNENGHMYVDLGLPSGTMWATCNFGAFFPAEYGDYYNAGGVDPVKESWGGRWETPSIEDWDELVSNCTYYYNEGGCFVFKSNINQKSIFIPLDQIPQKKMGYTRASYTYEGKYRTSNESYCRTLKYTESYDYYYGGCTVNYLYENDNYFSEGTLFMIRPVFHP